MLDRTRLLLLPLLLHYVYLQQLLKVDYLPSLHLWLVIRLLLI